MRTKANALFPCLIMLVLCAAGANAGTWGIGFLGGYPYQYSSNAVSSNTLVFVDTEFDEVSPLVGGRLFYMFSDPAFAGVDISIRSHSMDVEADGESLGTLRLKPILLGLTFRQMRDTAGFGVHGGLALGISLNDFEKTAYLDTLEAEDPRLDISVKTSFAMTFDFGVDYFVARFLALSLDGLWAVNEVSTDGWWDAEHLFIGGSTMQLLAGATIWFK
jgi:hypothetical protein